MATNEFVYLYCGRCKKRRPQAYTGNGKCLVKSSFAEMTFCCLSCGSERKKAVSKKSFFSNDFSDVSREIAESEAGK